MSEVHFNGKVIGGLGKEELEVDPGWISVTGCVDLVDTHSSCPYSLG